MIKIDRIEADGFKPAIVGMRNSFNSWDKSDSYDTDWGYHVGQEDQNLALKLSKSPSEGKFLRMINVYFDITAPLYWWKEMDTYKVGTVCNSCSTMHTLTKAPITVDMFSTDVDGVECKEYIRQVVDTCESLRKEYLFNKDPNVWRMLIQLLPCSFNQKRLWVGNYQVLQTIYHQRKNHKLEEWRTFCSRIKSLPYSNWITED